MRVLVTGASGFLGRRLVIRLLKEGHSVTVFGRSEKIPKEIEFIKGDILNRDDIERATKTKPDVVYHLAAILDENDSMMTKVNVEGTKNILRKDIGRIILVSSIGILGEANFPLTEESPYRPETKYEKSKMNQEKIVKESGIPYTILRTTIIYGPNNIWADIIKMAGKGFPMIGSGKNFWHLVYIDDVIDALVLALKPEAKNQVFNIADADPKTYREIYKEITEALRVPFPKKKIPVFLAVFLSKLTELRGKAGTTSRSSSIKRLVRNRIVDISKARKVLGYNPKYDFKTGIKKTIEELEKR